MSSFDRLTLKIKSRFATSRNLSALTPASAEDFGVTMTDLTNAVRQRADVLQRLTCMAEVHGVPHALKTAGRYELFEMARKCDQCFYERKCARMLSAASRLRAKDVDFCPNAAEYALLAVESQAAKAP